MLSLLQVFFFVIIEQQLASLAEWLGFSCIPDCTWVLNLVSTFSDIFSYLRGMLEPELDRLVQGKVHRITYDARFLRLKKPNFHSVPS